MPKEKTILVKGTPYAMVKFLFKNAAGNTYNTTTETFSSGNNYMKIEVGPNGYTQVPVIIPDTTSDDTYSISVLPSAKVDIKKELIEKEDIITFKEYVPKVLTWTTSHTTSGYTVASALSTSLKGTANTYNNDDTVGSIEITGAISKSSALLYTTGQPDRTAATGGSFTNSNRANYTVDLVEPSDATVLLNGDANIHDDMKLVLVGGNLVEDTVTISKNGSNNISLRDFTEFPNIEIEQELTFSEGGWLVDVDTATITGTGTTSLTGTVITYIKRIGSADATITWRLQDSITTVPNAYDMAVSCSIDDVTTSFFVQDGNGIPQIGDPGTCSRISSNRWGCLVDSGYATAGDEAQQDIDANKDSKTYTLVSKSGMTVDGDLKGTLGNTGDFTNDTFYTGATTRDKITFKYAAGDIGDTCSFTYKANDGANDSATKTVTITLTA